MLELFMFKNNNFSALVERDEDATRYELLIHVGRRKEQAADVRLSTSMRGTWLTRKAAQESDCRS